MDKILGLSALGLGGWQLLSSVTSFTKASSMATQAGTTLSMSFGAVAGGFILPALVTFAGVKLLTNG